MAVDRREEDDDSEQGWAKLFQLGFACSLLGYIGLGVNRLDTRLNKLDTKLSDRLDTLSDRLDTLENDMSAMKGDLSLVKLLCCSLVTWGLAKEWNSHLDSLGKSKSA